MMYIYKIRIIMSFFGEKLVMCGFLAKTDVSWRLAIKKLNYRRSFNPLARINKLVLGVTINLLKYKYFDTPSYIFEYNN